MSTSLPQHSYNFKEEKIYLYVAKISDLEQGLLLDTYMYIVHPLRAACSSIMYDVDTENWTKDFLIVQLQLLDLALDMFSWIFFRTAKLDKLMKHPSQLWH